MTIRKCRPHIGFPALFLLALGTLRFIHSQEPLVLLEPNGGEQYVIGDTIPVRFEADENSVSLVAVDISLDGGEIWLTLFSGGITAGGQGWEDTFWVVPPEIPGPPPSRDPVSTVSSQCLIKIYNYVYAGMRDISDSTFSIYSAASVVDPADPPPADSEEDSGGCGTGTGTALLPPLLARISRRWRRRKRRQQSSV